MNAVALVPVAVARVALLTVCGESLLSRAIHQLLLAGTVRSVVVTTSPADYAGVHSELMRCGDSVRILTVEPHDVVGCSVTEAVRAVPEADVVLVQEPTRAFTPVSLIDEVVRAVEQGAAAAVPVLPVTDTIKRVDSAGNVRATVDRSLLRVVQGPQAYGVDVFVNDVSAAGRLDGVGVEWLDRVGKPAVAVPGHPHARKIETRFDLAVAQAMVADHATGASR